MVELSRQLIEVDNVDDGADAAKASGQQVQNTLGRRQSFFGAVSLAVSLSSIGMV